MSIIAVIFLHYIHALNVKNEIYFRKSKLPATTYATCLGSGSDIMIVELLVSHTSVSVLFRCLHTRIGTSHNLWLTKILICEGICTATMIYDYEWYFCVFDLPGNTFSTGKVIETYHIHVRASRF